MQKLLLALLPLAWGLVIRVVWDTSKLLPAYPLKQSFNWIITCAIFAPIVYKSYYRPLKESLSINLSLLGARFNPISLVWFLGVLVAAFASGLFVDSASWYSRAVAYGIIISPLLEELISRSFFIRYNKISGREFLVWAVVSSAAFSLMHWAYLADLGRSITGARAIAEKFFDHFTFSFLLSLITYKTKRLEPAIIIHGLSNLRYALQCAVGDGAIALIIASINTVIQLICISSWESKN